MKDKGNAVAGYLDPIGASESFRSLLSMNTRAPHASGPHVQASPLWSDHELMRLRPH